MNIYNGYTTAKNKVIFYPPGNENTATPSSTGNSLFIINPDGTILSKVMYLFFLNIWANISIVEGCQLLCIRGHFDFSCLPILDDGLRYLNLPASQIHNPRYEAHK